jgi:U3 small nucleolar RNA-associated protein 18
MSVQRQPDASDDAFSDFEENSSSSEVDEAEEQADNAAESSDKDSEEEELERLVLGDRATFREQLFRDEFTSGIEGANESDAAGRARDTGLEAVEDSALFFIDAAAPTRDKQLVVAEGGAEEVAKLGNAPAWEDSDDERLSISLATVSQLRKFRIAEGEDVVNGTEYTRRLRQQYLQLYPHPEWAREAEGRPIKRRRRSSASSGSSASDESGLEDSDPSALPLEKFLRDASSFNTAASAKRRKLKPEVLGIQRSRDIPGRHSRGVTSLAFHPKYPILLSSSASSILHLHHIAPTAYPTPNPSLASVQLRGTPIYRCQFLGPDGDEIIIAGRRRYFHSWNLASGVVKKVSQFYGHGQEQKTTERFRASPCGRYIGFIASVRRGGGMLNILSAGSMQWVAQAHIDSRGGIVDFAWWSDGEGMTMLGGDGTIAEWSMSTRKGVGIWRDAGSVGSTVIALGGRGGPQQLGGDRWVSVGSNTGIVNVYDRNNLVKPSTSADDEIEIVPAPEPNRTFEQLTTEITSVVFSPDGQLLAFVSEKKRDALRMVHLPSLTVYRNWPTQKTRLGLIAAVAFSTQSDMLAVANEKGKIRLWDIRS